MFSKTVLLPSIILTVSLLGILGLQDSQTFADVISEPIMPGYVDGIGTYFEINDSEYLNIQITSSASVDLSAISEPNMISLQLYGPENPTDTSSRITLTGLPLSAVFHKYVDSLENYQEMHVDEYGSVSFSVDLTNEHNIYIMTHKSTKFIYDDLTGGDCASIGNWDDVTHTCTLTGNVGESIQVSDNNITLDGNGFSITGQNTGVGLNISGTGVTVKNISLENFTYGVITFSADNLILENSSFSNSIRNGLLLQATDNAKIKNNVFDANNIGITVKNASVNDITSNDFTGSQSMGIFFSFGNNDNNTFKENFFGESTRLAFGGGADRFVNNDNDILDNQISSQNGIMFIGKSGLSSDSSGLAISGNSFFSGIAPTHSANSLSLVREFDVTISENVFTPRHKNTVAITLNIVDTAQIFNNTVGSLDPVADPLQPTIGLSIKNSDFVDVYNNNFGGGEYVRISTSDVKLNQDVPIGGNFYLFHDRGNITPPGIFERYCIDENSDGFCDLSFSNTSFDIVTDRYPWANPNGWLIPVDTAAPIITSIPSDIVVEAISSSGTTATFTIPVATDDVDGPVPVICNAISDITLFSYDPVLPNPDSAIVTCNATDDAGNTAQAIFHVTVRDTMSPVITLNGNASITLEAGVDTYTEQGATADDVVDGMFATTVGGDTVDVNTVGAYFVTYDVTDASGNVATQVTRTVNVVDTTPPVITLNHSPVTINEGDVFTGSGSFTDLGVNDDQWTATVDYGEGNGPQSLTSNLGKTFSLSNLYEDNGTYSVSVVVTDTNSNSASSTFDVTVNNVAPDVVGITSDLTLIPIGTLISVGASFTDSGIIDTHTALWDWNDANFTPGMVSQGSGSGSVTNSHTYDNPGVYTVTLTVTDDDGGFDTLSTTEFVVVYDPDGGFVTGGGWIDSPLGSCTFDECTDDTIGKATFGFVSKYKNGATEPSGNTQFHFKAGNLKFKSSDYEWLTIVISGAKAQYKGTGTINGEGDYGFILTGFDAELNDNDAHIEDKFRIKIWDNANGSGVVYDNKRGASDNAEDATTIGGGNIKIHKGN